MLYIFQILTKPDLKKSMYLPMMVQKYHGNQLNKQWLSSLQIIQRYLQLMKQVVNMYA